MVNGRSFLQALRLVSIVQGFMVALVLSLTLGFGGESKGLTRARGISNQLFLAALSG